MIIDELCRDLAAEHADLDPVVAGLTAEEWARPSPAARWDVRDCLSHICWFDETATVSITDPERFTAHATALRQETASGVEPGVALGRELGDGRRLVERWRKSREAFIDAAAHADPKARVPWYGLQMSPASLATARLMETWAHGVDIRDAVGAPVVATDRLRHVLHIGYNARAFAFSSHDVVDPGDPVRLLAAAPDGGEWAWGPEDAANRISGSALGLALLFTQRRHPDQTDVVAAGPVARQWVAIAQAFAGRGTVPPADR